MKAILLPAVLLLATTLHAADLPSGQKTPEGVACDAVTAFIHCDAKAWSATLVRPIYGEKDEEYADFQRKMAASADKAKADKSFKPPRLVKCFKARSFSMNGPGSAAFAIADLSGNMFVDLLLEVSAGETKRLRYHVVRDKDKKWYFEPRPDLCPLFSMGLNEESESTDVLYEAK